MDAPTYPPATAFDPPRSAAAPFSIDNYSLQELFAYPAVQTLILREIPSLQMAVRAPQLQPHLGNFTLRSFANFGVASMTDVDRVDGLIRALPHGQRPGQ